MRDNHNVRVGVVGDEPGDHLARDDRLAQAGRQDDERAAVTIERDASFPDGGALVGAQPFAVDARWRPLVDDFGSKLRQRRIVPKVDAAADGAKLGAALAGGWALLHV